ncbi:MAG TPA: Plug domain-containing protein, partial [Candidatus Solibacter sp.]|nr:Plug domain-containing protein [Candidatus Solibacter sp.]
MLAFFLLMCFPCLGQGQSPPPQEPATPEPVHTTITVSEKITTETPASVRVLDSLEIQRSPGVNLDDRLRDVPGFSLFRRSSSLVANPTTQGISLRGIGSSGASRTLVLWDNIPASDPFGGWVYWDQFVPIDIERVEISPGAATSAFGDRALSGAIGLFSRTAQKFRFMGDYEVGNQNTHDVSAGLANVWRHAAISGVARAFTSEGYFIVPANIRGPVDT